MAGPPAVAQWMQAGGSAGDATTAGPFARKAVQANSGMDHDPEMQAPERSATLPASHSRALHSKNSEPLLDEYPATPTKSLPLGVHRTLKSHQLETLPGQGWLLGREQWLGVLSMVLLILQGTALSLILRLSRWAAAAAACLVCARAAAEQAQLCSAWQQRQRPAGGTIWPHSAGLDVQDETGAPVPGQRGCDLDRADQAAHLRVRPVVGGLVQRS